VRDVEVVPDPREQRTDADELGPHRERDREQADQEREALGSHGASAAVMGLCFEPPRRV
jgi:hypothetical protein